MQTHMNSAIKHLKVLYTVVQRIAVFMVDMFMLCQFPPDVLLHYPAVRPDLFTVSEKKSGASMWAKRFRHVILPFQLPQLRQELPHFQGRVIYGPCPGFQRLLLGLLRVL